MTKLLDARGRACPEPVMLTIKAIGDADQVTVIVDNAVAQQNVTRLAQSRGFLVATSQGSDGIYLSLIREGASSETAAPDPAPRTVPSVLPSVGGSATPTEGATVVFVASDCLGQGPAELGERLLGVFFHTLLDVAPRPKTIIFMNAGVKLTVDGSRALDDLQELARQGSEILVCGTCLSYFELTEKLRVGQISNMYDIARAFLEASKVIKL